MKKEILLKRLSYIKYLYTLGEKEANKPYPLNSFSILIFHDCLEMLFILAAEYLSTETKNFTSFLDYYEKLKDKDGNKILTSKTSLIRLNEVRRSLKHKGIMPSPVIINEICIFMKMYLYEIIKNTFNIDFSNISLLSLLNDKEVKEILYEAEKFKDDTKLEDAICKVSKGYAILIDNAREKLLEHRQPIFKTHFREKASTELRRIGESNNPKIGSVIDTLNERVYQEIDELKNYLLLQVLDIDYVKLIKFINKTPVYKKTKDGTDKFDFINKKQVTYEDYKFAFDFVIECALKIQNKII